jgi:diguanylate cyclase (GGDEF)-like protein/PAS domain S-box-containing protein
MAPDEGGSRPVPDSGADEEVRRRETQLAEAQALFGLGSWEWHVRTGGQSWSEETFRILGRDPAGFEPTFDAFLDCVHPDDRQRLADAVAGATEPGSEGLYELEHRIVRPDGEERICCCRGRVFLDEDGTPLRMIGAIQDVTKRRPFDVEPAAERLGRILDSAHEAFVTMDGGGFVTGWNQAAEEIFGWSRAEAIGRVLADLIVPPELRDAHWAGLRRFLETGEGPVLGRRLELSALGRDRREFPVELTISALEYGGRWEFHAFLRDISERKRSEVEREALIEQLNSLARTDELTGLLNRRAWDEELSRELARAARESGHVCVAMLDLDGFKAYNDAHGHHAGDELLRAVARTWRGHLRVTDVLARYGGEEFAVAFPAWPLETALVVVERLRTDIPAGQKCSAGLVAWNGTETAADLLGRADEALYEAKRTGRDRTVAWS